MMRVLFIGGHGHHYLSPAARDGRVEAIAWAGDGHDADAARSAMARRLEIDGPFRDDYRLALDELKPDAVNIGAMYGHNGEVVLEALRRGVKVVSDKPVAATWPQLEAIERHCEAHRDAVLLTEFNLRSRPAFRAAKRAVEQGRVGTPVLATAQKSYRWGQRAEFYKRRADYGGTLLWIASHGIDAIWYATGIDLAGVAGGQGNLARPDYGDAEDHVALCYRLANGGHAMAHADFLRPAAAPTHGDDRIRIAGSAGLLEVRDDRCMLTTADEPPTDITGFGQGAAVTGDLLAALDGDTSVYSTAASVQMARWLLHSRDAADRGQWVTFSG